MSIPPPLKVNGNSKGDGVAKARLLKKKYGAVLEFPAWWWGGRANQKKYPMGGVVWIFLEPHNTVYTTVNTKVFLDFRKVL